MWDSAAIVCLVLYLICSCWFFAGSSLQLHLLWQSRKPVGRFFSKPIKDLLPFITIQVPVYNERFVIDRLLTSLGKFDYPQNLFEIQILDDSTDETTETILKSVKKLAAKNITATVVHREQREGFKAGALQAGLETARGSLIAIFDADFEPAPDFLMKMAGYFEDPRVGGVQGKWGHRNLYENWLTTLQVFLLDSNFTLEQQGRSNAGYFVNFNGTAGMWRKQCIIDAGGWNGEVLTEDLELSYRAQLAGWKFLYDQSVTVPADLPGDMDAFKTQQFRWAKGLAQSAVCHLPKVIRSNNSTVKKIHAVFHLLSSASFVAVLGNIILALPIIIGRHSLPVLKDYSQLIFITGITLPVLFVYYAVGTKSSLRSVEFWKYLPLFLVVYMALSVQNTIAVLQGIFGYSSPFVRTPKPGKSILRYSESNVPWTWINSIEAITLIYIITSIVVSLVWRDYFLITFLAMSAIGLVLILLPVIRNLFAASRKVATPVINLSDRRKF